VTYTSSTLALAALEMLVHVDEADAPESLVAVPADIPESISITRVDVSALPRDWRRTPAPESLADIGSRWIRAQDALALAVPSAIIPQELNYLLNPLHRHFKRIRVGRPEPFSFDPRLWR
jgi:RES domain-containing protein